MKTQITLETHDDLSVGVRETMWPVWPRLDRSHFDRWSSTVLGGAAQLGAELGTSNRIPASNVT